MLNRQQLFNKIRRGDKVTVRDGTVVAVGIARWKNDNGFYVYNEATGLNSYVHIPKPALIESYRNTFRFYKAGYRPLKESERDTLRSWELRNSNGITDKFAFFREQRASYLVGFGVMNGKCLDRKRYANGITDCVYDEYVKGDLAYEITFERV